MASLITKFHCSNCDVAIEQKVTYRRYNANTDDIMHYPELVIIDPDHCPLCGELFTAVDVELPREV